MQDYLLGIFVGMFIVLYFWSLYMKVRRRQSIQSPISIALVVKGGYTPVISKRDSRFRHSPRNTIVGFLIYKDGVKIGYIENEQKKGAV